MAVQGNIIINGRYRPAFVVATQLLYPELNLKTALFDFQSHGGVLTDPVLDIVSKIGCGISIAALVLTIIVTVITA